ncbi:MAG TPA: winged helix-turn-helix domain-containing protein [Terriglobales bacterium]|nr:winged helix-turn-helix domain-containing protein [Terriglobales bacterium]
MSVKAVPGNVRLFRFGPYELDTKQGELRRSGVRVALQGQPLRILELLLLSPGQLVSREQFREALWPNGTFVDFDDGLNTCVRRLRQALNDDPETPRFIQTLPKRGYRFVGDVETIPDEGPPVQTLTHAIGPATTKPRRHVLVAIGITMAVLVLAAAGVVFRYRRHNAASPIRSLAVLPLENLSHDPEQEYFADGITDALITDLAQIGSLKVISRTSTSRYKGTHKLLPEIAKELSVDGVVEGTVLRSGDRVRVDAQLIEANTDRHVWAKSYERNLGDVIALQNEVARAIANEVQVKLTPQEKAHLSRADSVDPQTYELYLRGRYFWSKRGEDSIRKSIDYFQQAIQRSPKYALAYAGLAEAYVVNSDVVPQERLSAAKAAARRALAIDDGLAEAHNALAASLFFYDWDFDSAEKEFRRALALNPNYAQAHQWYAQYLLTMGRQNSAVEELKRAEELEPLSHFSGGSGRYGKQYDLIIEHARKELELDPSFFRAYSALGGAYALKGMYRDSIAAYQKARDLSGGSPGVLGGMGYTYAVWGRRAEALKILEELKELSKQKFVSPYYIAKVYVGLGEKDLAFSWLQKAVADRSIPLPGLKTDEELSSLRSDPRYHELLNRIGLPQ